MRASERRTFPTPKDGARATVVSVVAVAVFYAILIAVKLAATGSPASFIVAGEKYAQAGTAPIPANQIDSTFGYDGQFYFRFALAPWSTAEVEHGITIDVGPYRHQRILYPLLVYLTSFGNPAIAVWSMIGVNYLAILGVALFSALLARRIDQSAYWGLFIALYPGLMFAVLRNLTDVLALAWVLAAVHAGIAGRWGRFSVFATLAVLSRESTLIVPATAAFLAARGLVTRQPGALRNMMLAVVPIVIYLCWFAVCTYRWSDSALTPTPRMFGVPFMHFLSFIFHRAWEASVPVALVWVGTAALLAGWMIQAAIRLRAAAVPDLVKWTFAAYALLLCGMNVWREDIGFTRIFAPGFALAAFVLAGSAKDSRLTRVLLAGWLGVSLLTLYRAGFDVWLKAMLSGR